MDRTFINYSSWRSYFIISVLAFAAYAPTLKVGFLWDDHTIIENNPYISHWTWSNVKHDFLSDNTQGTGDNYYRPFQAFSHRMDYSLWRLNPFGYHLSDLLVHVANGLLLYQLIMALGFTPLVGLMTACLFVVNPIGVEQFIIPSGRTTPLSFFFSLSCILFLLQKGFVPIALGLLSCALASFTKEIGTITPLLVALVFFFKNERWQRYWIIAPLLGLTGLYLFMRNMAVHQISGPIDIPLLLFFITKVFPGVLFHYVWLILYPWLLYSHHPIGHLSHIWILYLSGLLGLIIGLIWGKGVTGLFCLAWIIVGLLPTIPVMMRGSFMLDHWGYPIALGVLLPLGLLFAKGWQARRPIVRHISNTLYFSLIIIWSLLVHLNVSLRGTDEKMYRWALHFTYSHPIKYNLAVLLLETGRSQEAINYLEEIRGDYPEDPNNINALALAYWKTGHQWLAIDILEKYAKSYPSNALTQHHLQVLKALYNKK